MASEDETMAGSAAAAATAPPPPPPAATAVRHAAAHRRKEAGPSSTKALDKLLVARLAPVLDALRAIQAGLHSWKPGVFDEPTVVAEAVAAAGAGAAVAKPRRPPTEKQLAWQAMNRKYGVGHVPPDAPELLEYTAKFGAPVRKGKAGAGGGGGGGGGGQAATAVTIAVPSPTAAAAATEGVVGAKRRRALIESDEE